jgi:hypothetical protein
MPDESRRNRLPDAAMLAGVGGRFFVQIVILAMLAFLYGEIRRLNNPGIPAIPGATAEEQESEVVRSGFNRGLQCRRLLQSTWAESLLEVAQDVRQGTPWPDAKAKFSRDAQGRRDDPIFRLLERDLAQYYPLDRVAATAEQRRHAFLYQSAFGAGYLASSRP